VYPCGASAADFGAGLRIFWPSDDSVRTRDGGDHKSVQKPLFRF